MNRARVLQVPTMADLAREFGRADDGAEFGGQRVIIDPLDPANREPLDDDEDDLKDYDVDEDPRYYGDPMK